jgi:hypothetical protein
MNRMYTVAPVGPGIYQVTDMQTGVILNRFNLPGELVSGPVVSGDSCSIVIKQHGIQLGYTVALPSGMVRNRFNM